MGILVSIFIFFVKLSIWVFVATIILKLIYAIVGGTKDNSSGLSLSNNAHKNYDSSCCFDDRNPLDERTNLTEEKDLEEIVDDMDNIKEIEDYL